MSEQIEGRMKGLIGYTTRSIVSELNRYVSISPSGDVGVKMGEAARRFGGGDPSEAEEINIQNRARATAAALLPIVMNGCHRFPDYAVMDMIQGVLWRNGGYDDQPAIPTTPLPDRATARRPPNVQALIHRWEPLNGCQGGSGDDPKTTLACAQRDKIAVQLQKLHWCWQPPTPGGPGYLRDWRPCS
jgi:hypothetical protein